MGEGWTGLRYGNGQDDDGDLVEEDGGGWIGVGGDSRRSFGDPRGCRYTGEGGD